jgi:hypothetical protein
MQVCRHWQCIHNTREWCKRDHAVRSLSSVSRYVVTTCWTTVLPVSEALAGIDSENALCCLPEMSGTLRTLVSMCLIERINNIISLEALGLWNLI